jgi:hypothetical protein
MGQIPEKNEETLVAKKQIKKQVKKEKPVETLEETKSLEDCGCKDCDCKSEEKSLDEMIREVDNNIESIQFTEEEEKWFQELEKSEKIRVSLDKINLVDLKVEVLKRDKFLAIEDKDSAKATDIEIEIQRLRELKRSIIRETEI